MRSWCGSNDTSQGDGVSQLWELQSGTGRCRLCRLLIQRGGMRAMHKRQRQQCACGTLGDMGRGCAVKGGVERSQSVSQSVGWHAVNACHWSRETLWHSPVYRRGPLSNALHLPCTLWQHCGGRVSPKNDLLLPVEQHPGRSQPLWRGYRSGCAHAPPPRVQHQRLARHGTQEPRQGPGALRWRS